MSLLTTASQTVGPFVSIGFSALTFDNLAAPGVVGQRVIIGGRVVDGDGKPVSDAVVETWQADAEGRYAYAEDGDKKPAASAFRGFGRMLPDPTGGFRLTTIKPGAVRGPGGAMQAPHIVVVIFMRGLLKHLMTRIYFPDEAANTTDPILKLVPAERRATLIAKKTMSDELEWNVILQGKDETVFFSY